MQGSGGEEAPAGVTVVGSPSSPRNGRLFRDLLDRFAVLAETCYRFSRDIYHQTGDPPEADLEGTVRRNLAIARHVFAEGLLEVLAVIYLEKTVAFEDLRRLLGAVPAAALEKQLASLEATGLVQRESRFERIGRSRLSLTHKGVTIARLGEPIFLYLRMAEGWSKPE